MKGIVIFSPNLDVFSGSGNFWQHFSLFPDPLTKQQMDGLTHNRLELQSYCWRVSVSADSTDLPLAKKKKSTEYKLQASCQPSVEMNEEADGGTW